MAPLLAALMVSLKAEWKAKPLEGKRVALWAGWMAGMLVVMMANFEAAQKAAWKVDYKVVEKDEK